MIKQIVCIFSLLCCLLETNAAPINKEVTVSGKIGKYTYVDLGLSVMWATYNVGASKPTDKGNCYAWGETKPKASYTPKNYKFSNDSCRTFSKYVMRKGYGKVDSIETLNPEDDVATVIWGNDWKMPTEVDAVELQFGCIWEQTDDYNGSGVAGYIGTSRFNGNTIFFPIYRDSNNYFYDSKYDYNLPPRNYWTSSVYCAGDAYGLVFGDVYGVANIFEEQRFLGNCIRAVSKTRKRYKNELMTVSGKNGIYTYVDLGLSVKWATFNVGASKPSECGDYFAWGETQPKSSYEKTNYKWSKDSCRTFNKYVNKIDNCDNCFFGSVDNLKTLKPSDDAATVNWGNSWRMPTIDELLELYDNCDWQFIRNFYGSGVAGRLGVSKKNGNMIFFPFGHYQVGDFFEFLIESGSYGISSVNQYWTYVFSAGPDDWDHPIYDNQHRCRGRRIRAVCK